MNLPDIVSELLAAKQRQGLSFTDLEKILDRDEVWIAAVLYRQAAAAADEAKLLVEALGVLIISIC
jgi:cyanate lyase